MSWLQSPACSKREKSRTNAPQDAIYRCLASPAGDDLFLVGDLKQSIYRFRQADPSIFRTKLDVWAPLPGGTARPRPAEGTPGTDALLALDANFRSAPQVVAGINFIFLVAADDAAESFYFFK